VRRGCLYRREEQSLERQSHCPRRHPESLPGGSLELLASKKFISEERLLTRALLDVFARTTSVDVCLLLRIIPPIHCGLVQQVVRVQQILFNDSARNHVANPAFTLGSDLDNDTHAAFKG
jgi:hypothetical protein